MLKIKNVSKSYKDLEVLKNVDFEIFKGELIGIIGSNGAGKTTLINTIMNNLDFTGEIIINGIQNEEYLSKYRDDIIFLPDNVFYYEFLTGIEFIKFVLDLKKISFNKVKRKVELLFQLFHLEEQSNFLIKEYSLGMKRKVALISVLIQSPKILLLDEPVSGLDAMSLIALKKLLASMAKGGTTIIFTTHILDFVENLCDSLVVLNDKNAVKINEIGKMSKAEIENRFLQIVENEINADIEDYFSVE